MSKTTISFTHWDGNTYTGEVSFVARYLTPHSNGLSTAESKALSDAGLSVVSVWEMSDKISRMTLANGQSDAERAFDEANKLGQPSDAPIYFAVDTSGAGHLAAIQAYFQGITDTARKRVEDSKPVYPVGVYGTKLVLDFLYGLGKDTGWLTNYYWQAGAPSMDAGNDIEFGPGDIWQFTPGHYPNHCGIQVDHNVAMKGSPGGWMLSTP